jgi:hypothetical protein
LVTLEQKLLTNPRHLKNLTKGLRTGTLAAQIERPLRQYGLDASTLKAAAKAVEPRTMLSLNGLGLGGRDA